MTFLKYTKQIETIAEKLYYKYYNYYCYCIYDLILQAVKETLKEIKTTNLKKIHQHIKENYI